MCCYLKLNTFLGHWWRVWLIGGLRCYISPFIRYLAPHHDFPDRVDIKKMVGCLPTGSHGKLRQLVVHRCRFSLYWGPAACVSMQWSETFWNVGSFMSRFKCCWQIFFQVIRYKKTRWKQREPVKSHTSTHLGQYRMAEVLQECMHLNVYSSSKKKVPLQQSSLTSSRLPPLTSTAYTYFQKEPFVLWKSSGTPGKKQKIKSLIRSRRAL